MSRFETIRHVLLDIEGTTCPIHFVSEVLFPYASQQLLPFLTEHQSEAAVEKLLKEVRKALADDPSPEAIALRSPTASATDHGQLPLQTLCGYLAWLIKTDRKVTALKDLQGMIWEEGYQRGTLIAPLFADVPKALTEWHRKGIGLSVYSSGSVHAQKLLYSHSEFGDLSHLFSHWFDTRTGPKNIASSYERIAKSLQTNPEEILFISDAVAELEAASSANMPVLFSKRANNPQQDPKWFPTLDDFGKLHL